MRITQSETYQDRVQTLDASRGVLIALVTVGHATQWLASANHTSVWDIALFKFIYIFHMPAFMILAGYLAIQGSKTKPAKETIQRRIQQLITPIVFASIVISFTNITKGTAAATAAVDGLRFFAKGLWFNWTLLTCHLYLVAASQSNSHQKLILLLGIPALQLAPDFLVSRETKHLYTFFIFGALAQNAIRHIASASLAPKYQITLLLIFSVTYLSWDHQDFIYFDNPNFSTMDGVTGIAKKLVGGCAGTVLLLQICGSLPILNSRLVGKLGQLTLPIYVVQQTILQLVPNPSSGAPISNLALQTQSVIIGLCATTALAATAQLMDSYAPKLYRTIFPR